MAPHVIRPVLLPVGNYVRLVPVLPDWQNRRGGIAICTVSVGFYVNYTLRESKPQNSGVLILASMMIGSAGESGQSMERRFCVMHL